MVRGGRDGEDIRISLETMHAQKGTNGDVISRLLAASQCEWGCDVYARAEITSTRPPPRVLL